MTQISHFTILYTSGTDFFFLNLPQLHLFFCLFVFYNVKSPASIYHGRVGTGTALQATGSFTAAGSTEDELRLLSAL